MTSLHSNLEGAAIVFAIIAAALIVGEVIVGLCQMTGCGKREVVMYRGAKETGFYAVLTTAIGALMLCSAGALALAALTGCSTAPKPHPIPLQSAPAKAEKTPIQTWTDFFESRD